MLFEPSRNRREPDRKPPAWLIVAGVLVLAVVFFGGSTWRTGNHVFTLSAGYFIGIPQLLIVGFIGYWFGKAKSAGDLAPDEDAPSFTDRVRAVKKSDDGKRISGVCAGLGEHTPVPAWIWRVLFILFALASGFGLFAYLVLAFAMPEAPKPEKKPPLIRKTGDVEAG